MGREVRRVPPNWEHPKDEYGNYKGLHDRSFEKELKEWDAGKANWKEGGDPDFVKVAHEDGRRYGDKYTWEEWYGEVPSPAWYVNYGGV